MVGYLGVYRSSLYVYDTYEDSWRCNCCYFVAIDIWSFKKEIETILERFAIYKNDGYIFEFNETEDYVITADKQGIERVIYNLDLRGIKSIDKLNNLYSHNINLPIIASAMTRSQCLLSTSSIKHFVLSFNL